MKAFTSAIQYNSSQKTLKETLINGLRGMKRKTHVAQPLNCPVLDKIWVERGCEHRATQRFVRTDH